MCVCDERRRSLLYSSQAMSSEQVSVQTAICRATLRVNGFIQPALFVIIGRVLCRLTVVLKREYAQVMRRNSQIDAQRPDSSWDISGGSASS